MILGKPAEHLEAAAIGDETLASPVIERLNRFEEENGLLYVSSEKSLPEMMGETTAAGDRLPVISPPTAEELHRVLADWIAAHSRDPVSMVHALHVLRDRL